MSDRNVISAAEGPRRVARHLWYLLPVVAATAAAGIFHVFSLHRHARQLAAISAAATNQPAILEAHSPYDSPEARARLWEQLRQMQAASAMDDIRKLLAIVAKTDPGLALEMVQSLTSDDLGRNLLAAGIVQVWAAHDPEGAWRWALGPGKALDVTCQPPLSETVLAGMANTHPQMLIQFVEGILGSSGNTSDPCAGDGRKPRRRAAGARNLEPRAESQRHQRFRLRGGSRSAGQLVAEARGGLVAKPAALGRTGQRIWSGS
jgi:ABC-type cobalamin transport system ATPase subunit